MPERTSLRRKMRCAHCQSPLHDGDVLVFNDREIFHQPCWRINQSRARIDESNQLRQRSQALIDFRKMRLTLRSGISLTAVIGALESRLIDDALEAVAGVQTRAAALLGISERVLRYKLSKYRRIRRRKP